MSGKEVLIAAEKNATLDGGPVVANVVGKAAGQKAGRKKKTGAISAGGFLTAIIVVFLLIFSSGNFTIAAFNDRILEETDVQCADATESKLLVLQQALSEGDLPANTVARLKDYNVLVGYVGEDGFTESANGNALLVNSTDVVTAGQFVSKAHENINLYNAVNEATYSCAAYYYDEAAETVFRELGTSRNNYKADVKFEEVMSDLMGEGSNIDVNGVARVEKEDEEGNKYYDYETVGAAAKSENGAEFVEAVRRKSVAANETDAALETAATVNVADNLSHEQRSALYYVSLMENFSKVKYGDGSTSKINDAMNYLYTETETTVVDVKTGELITEKGSAVNAPSLYAILSGEKVNANSVENYANDRVLKTVQNTLGATASNAVMNGTVTSASNKTKGTISRFMSGSATASSAVVNAVNPTVEASLSSNGFGTISGIYAGEFLAEGAVSVGKMLAKQSGASAGDAAAVASYARLSDTIVALNNEADRLNRSPFDVTSKNTFLGSIVYKLALYSAKDGGVLKQLGSLSRVVASSFGGLLPVASADEESTAYLTVHGDCPTAERIGAVGTVGCVTNATFDTSTLDDPFNNAEFVAFVEKNTVLKNGVREIKAGSDLANYVLFNAESKVAEGVTDGSALVALQTGASKSSFLTDFVALVKAWLGADEAEMRIATKQAFVNSAGNEDWQKIYKYAQRYMSLARAAENARRYDGDETAYTNLKYFEGSASPVTAFLESYYAIK